MDVLCLCVCVFYCVCVQIEALRQADHPPKESYRDLIHRTETESFMEVGQGPNWGCSAEGKKKILLVTPAPPFVTRVLHL
jgi:hypothetical protein